MKGKLESGEETSRSWDGHRHEAQLAEDPFPIFVAHPMGLGELVEDGGESLFAVSRELDGLPDCVDDPTQDEFASGPTSITLEHLLQRDGFVAVLLVSVGLCEYFVEGVEQVSADGAHALLSALTELDEVIDEDIVAS